MFQSSIVPSLPSNDSQLRSMQLFFWDVWGLISKLNITKQKQNCYRFIWLVIWPYGKHLEIKRNVNMNEQPMPWTCVSIDINMRVILIENSVLEFEAKTRVKEWKKIHTPTYRQTHTIPILEWIVKKILDCDFVKIEVNQCDLSLKEK